MMSSESLLALEPCGQSKRWDREPDLGPALAKDSYTIARGSPESGVPRRVPLRSPPHPPAANPLGSWGRGGRDSSTIAPSSTDRCPHRCLAGAQGMEGGMSAKCGNGAQRADPRKTRIKSRSFVISVR
jgi:hypothetical protein